MNIDIVEGVGKNSGKPYKALKLTIGDWKTYVFPKSKFEMDYIEKYINGVKEK